MLKTMRLTIATIVLAIALFMPLFATRGWGPLDFWWWLSANLVVLILIVAVFDPTWRRDCVQDLQERLLVKLALGFFSAFLLYWVFAVGNVVSRHLFSLAGSGINDVYAFKAGASGLRITLLMLLIIGPGEELYWRGFLQRSLQKRFGGATGFLFATGLYTFVHVSSGNIMLVLAAAVCGLFWGYLYLRFKSILLNVVSHTLWDVTVFLLLPFT